MLAAQRSQPLTVIMLAQHGADLETADSVRGRA